MKKTAEKLLNPSNHHLSKEAKKRLTWMYILYYKQSGNISKTARKIGISRQWLSYLKSVQYFKQKKNIKRDRRTNIEGKRRFSQCLG